MSHRPRIALCTNSAFPQLFDDEQELPSRLARAGIDAEAVIWSDPAVDWRRYDHVVLRSTWDYFERIAEFRAWLDRMESSGVKLANSAALIRWNLDKHYLQELQASGVPVVPTRFVDGPAELAALVADWPQAVLKPAISGNSWRTHRFAAAQAPALQTELEEIVAAGGALVQPFLPEIVDEGEYSFLFFGGVFSHAVLKIPATGDYRVQFGFGGRFVAVTPEPALLRQAEAVLRHLPEPPLYVRIDGIRRGHQFLLMEVEAIEPYLFMPHDAGAPDRYVQSLLALTRG